MDGDAATEGGAIEHRSLRSAIEYAVLMAEETQKRKPPMPVPQALRAFFGKPRIPAGALGRLRRAIEADDVFRERIAAGALPGLVDDVGRLWLQRPTGWVADAQRLIADAEREAAESDAVASLKRAERRRVAAEEAAVRSLAEIARLTAIVDEHQDEVDRLRADLTKADEALAETKAELIDVRNEARHSRDREAAAVARMAAVVAERDALAEQVAASGPAAVSTPMTICRPMPNSSRFASWRTRRREQRRTPPSVSQRSSYAASSVMPLSRPVPLPEPRRGVRGRQVRAVAVDRSRCRAASSPVRPRRRRSWPAAER